MTAGYQLTDGQMRDVRQTVRNDKLRHRGPGSMPSRPQPKTHVRRIAVVGSLSAPSSSVGVDPTSGVGALLKRTASTGRLSTTDDRIAFKNYTPDFTCADGTYGLVLWVDGVWELIWLACDNDASLTGLDPDP